MSGNKINTKTKGKPSGKSIDQNNEETEDVDFALLRKPVCTSVTGFGQARKIFDLATVELKTLLSEECDVLYECKVCRNIFRSLANFISHKRVYCKEKFNSTVHGHFIKSTSTLNELSKIKRYEENYQESLKENSAETMAVDDERAPLSKDLTEIIEKIAKKKKLCINNCDEQSVVTSTIPQSSVAVFQTIQPKNMKIDNMRIQVRELHSFLSKDTAVLQNDGKFKIQGVTPQELDNVIQISDDDDNDGCDNDLKCKICDMQFSTQKTLRFHMKYKHVESRLVYPCPDCLEIFSTSWSVYRHLFKVHRKTAAQIRRLRESIQLKAFKMNNPPAFYEKRKNNVKTTTAAQKITEEERLDQENQAWMDNMEGDGEGPRCGGCGRSFERRAALAAHTHTCVSRTRALAPRPPRRQDNKRIQIQIRRDYHKEPLTPQLANAISSATEHNADADVNGVKGAEEESQLPAIASDLPQNDEEAIHENEKTPEKNVTGKDDQNRDSNIVIPPPLSEKKQCPSLEEIPKPVIRLPFARQAEKRNLAAFKLKIQGNVDMDKLLCKKCETRCSTTQELYDHIAEHYKWMRYACKLCNFKHYDFDKLPEHVKMVHKLKGDKDFYFSTVKALDGPEALELCENVEEPNDPENNSPDSRRGSRCSSDSSRLSDDSSSSSIRVESGSRKRKAYQNKVIAKKRRGSVAKNGDEKRDDSLASDKEIDSDLSSNLKTFEENSSDIDEVDEKIFKRLYNDTPSVASRRPIRKKVKPLNEDFEYDLSNLLKMEAQGYRDSQTTTTTKPYLPKKKPQQEIQINYDNLNKDCCGALVTMSKKAVEKSAAHMRVSSFTPYFSQKDRPSNIFIRPMVPKISKGEKFSPKKEVEDKSKSSSPNLEQKGENKNGSITKEQKDKICNLKINKEVIIEEKKDASVLMKEQNSLGKITISNVKKEQKDQNKSNAPSTNDNEHNIVNGDSTKTIRKEDIHTVKECVDESLNKNAAKTSNSLCETIKTSGNIPAIVPIKFRRQSLEVIKNPLINKNIQDFTKTGMKTKILVIKPINRNQDGSKGSLTNPLKFQTITLKDPNKRSTSEDKSSDQVVVVKVPKVDCVIPRNTTEPSAVSKELVPVTLSNKEADNQCKESESAKTIDSIIEIPKIGENSDKTSESACNQECDSLPKNSEPPVIEEKLGDVDNENIKTDINCDNPDPSVDVIKAEIK